jgi:hypothetical protein
LSLAVGLRAYYGLADKLALNFRYMHCVVVLAGF